MDALRARMEHLLARPFIDGTRTDAATQQDQLLEQAVPWALQDWRITAIPEWREKLRISIEEKNQTIELEARWMLGEILEDPVYLKGEV